MKVCTGGLINTLLSLQVFVTSYCFVQLLIGSTVFIMLLSEWSRKTIETIGSLIHSWRPGGFERPNPHALSDLPKDGVLLLASVHDNYRQMLEEGNKIRPDCASNGTVCWFLWERLIMSYTLSGFTTTWRPRLSPLGPPIVHAWANLISGAVLLCILLWHILAWWVS